MTLLNARHICQQSTMMPRKLFVCHFKSIAQGTVCSPKKFKGGIWCGGHLAVSYGGELLYLRIFSELSLPYSFVKRELPFLYGLKLRTQIGYRVVNHAVTIMCADRAERLRQIQMYNNSRDGQYGRLSIALTQGSKGDNYLV